MRIRRHSLGFSLVIVAGVAALFTIPGEAKQAGSAAVPPQTSFGVLADPHLASALTIALPNGFWSA